MWMHTIPMLFALSLAKQPNGAELERAIERLSVVGNVLYVAAHPDDENTRLLGWLANDKLVRAAYLSLTRGEGGQNLIGPEQGPLLGLIRTQELLAARRLDRAEQFFTRARDFGYSKNPEETLSIWGHDDILADVVGAIRSFHPDVIVTRFSPEARDTHGHHTASAMLALEAFRNVTGVKRIVWNKGMFNAKPDEDLSGFIKMDVGGYNPTLGLSYGELAAQSRSMHKSQGFGAAPSRGPAPEYFRVLAGDPAKVSILEGLDLTWNRVKGGDKLAKILARARAGFKPTDPAASIPTLLEAQAALDALPDNPWKEPKRAELSEVIAACAGLFLEATAADYIAVPGGMVKVTAVALNRTNAPLTVKEITVGGVAIDHSEKSISVPNDARITNPSWLEAPSTRGHWGASITEDPPALAARFVLTAGTQTLTLERPVAYKWTDPVAGERHRALEVLPAVTLQARTPLMMFPDTHAKELRVVVRASAGTARGTVHPEAPQGWTVDPPSLPFALKEKDAEQELTFHVRPPAGATTGALALTADVDGMRADRGVTRVEYPHIPIQTTVPKAEVKLVRLDLQRGTRQRIGYIPGAGDDVPAALRQAGYDVTTAGDDYSKYDAIVIGVRAFNVKRLDHDRLMAYVHAGGTVIAQYNTKNWISKVPAEIGPYPFSISQDRVTDETATVEGDHRILHTPNKLTAADWNGWVQERGLYFADKWDEQHYEAPLSMHDPGEPPRRGGLLIARHGKGTFIYTGLAFFRQLPAGVPGAFRLFANLLAHGK